jgi:hypothetical protein
LLREAPPERIEEWRRRPSALRSRARSRRASATAGRSRCAASTTPGSRCHRGRRWARTGTSGWKKLPGATPIAGTAGKPVEARPISAPSTRPFLSQSAVTGRQRRLCRRSRGLATERARQDSNLRPRAPEARALSPELRARRWQLSSYLGEHPFVRSSPYRAVMNTLQRGDATEAALMSALTDRGFELLLPVSRGSPFDSGVALSANQLLRVQCKCGRVRDGCVVFNTMGPTAEAGPRTIADGRTGSECGARRSTRLSSCRSPSRQSAIWDSGWCHEEQPALEGPSRRRLRDGAVDARAAWGRA